MENRDQKIEEALTKGVAEVIDKDHLEERLKSKEILRIKFGIDPTSPDLHLGHSVPLRKLREFQELGQQVVFLIGDFTAAIGDPSGRLTGRKPLSEEEIKRNMEDYIAQAAKILDIKKVEIRYNSEWYKRKKIDFLMDLTSRFTYARLIERDEFKKRIEKDIDVSMLELIYPLLQGYDSVELKADLEIGGTDQKFNLLMGRKIQKRYGRPQQDIMTLPLLIGTDGANKMSKSRGNFINLKETASKMYGKIMSIPDALIWHYFELLTGFPQKEIEGIKNTRGRDLRAAKACLAKEIVKSYWGGKAASEAADEFIRVFKKKKLPSKIPPVKTPPGITDTATALTEMGITSSKSEAKRLIKQGGLKIDNETQTNWKEMGKLNKKGKIVQVGKIKVYKLF